MAQLDDMPVVEVTKANDGVFAAISCQHVAHFLQCLLLFDVSCEAPVPILPAHAMSEKPVQAAADVHAQTAQTLGVAWWLADRSTGASYEVYVRLSIATGTDWHYWLTHA